MKKLILLLSLMHMILCQAASMTVEKGKKEASSSSSALAMPYTPAQIAAQQQVAQLAVPQQQAEVVQELAPLEIRIEQEGAGLSDDPNISGTRVTLLRDGQEIISFNSEVVRMSRVAENMFESGRWKDSLENAVKLIFGDLNDEQIILIEQLLQKLFLKKQDDVKAIIAQLSYEKSSWLRVESDRVDIPLLQELLIKKDQHVFEKIYFKLFDKIPVTVKHQLIDNNIHYAHFTRQKDIILLIMFDEVLLYNVNTQEKTILLEDPPNAFFYLARYNNDETQLVLVGSKDIYIVDVKSRSIIKQWRHTLGINVISVNYNNDETKLLAANKYAIAIYDIESGEQDEPITAFDISNQKITSMRSATYNQDETGLIVVLDDYSATYIVNYNLTNRQSTLIKTIKGKITKGKIHYSYNKSKIIMTLQREGNKPSYFFAIYDLEHKTLKEQQLSFNRDPIEIEYDGENVIGAAYDPPDVPDPHAPEPQEINLLLWTPHINDSPSMIEQFISAPNGLRELPLIDRLRLAFTETRRIALGGVPDPIAQWRGDPKVIRLEYNHDKDEMLIVTNKGLIIVSIVTPHALWQSLNDDQRDFLLKTYEQDLKHNRPYIIHEQNDLEIYQDLPEVLQNNKWFLVPQIAQPEVIQEQQLPLDLPKIPQFPQTPVKDAFAKVGSKATAIYNNLYRWWTGQQEEWSVDRE